MNWTRRREMEGRKWKMKLGFGVVMTLIKNIYYNVWSDLAGFLWFDPLIGLFSSYGGPILASSLRLTKISPKVAAENKLLGFIFV